MRWDGTKRHQKTRIKPAFVAVVLTVTTALLPVEKAAAQPQLGNLLPQPRLAAVAPCGGKVDSTVEVTFSGLDLEEPKELVFSHRGIKATAIVPPAPPDPKADPKKPAPKPQQPRPPITKFKVTIADSVPVGTYDVRLVNKWGISNARAFVVGDLTEVAEKEPNNDVDQAQRVQINSTINGTIAAPTDVDYFVFAGKQGQRVVVSCQASSIDSRLNADLRLFDADDKQLASSREYNGSDALLDATLRSDGDYYVRLCHFTYSQGSPEYFYRLSITTAPWIDAVHPPMIEPGKSAKVTVYGRNLPGGKLDKSAVVDGRALEKITVTIKAPDEKQALQRLAYSGFKTTSAIGLDGFEYRIRNDSGTSNPVLLTYAKAPVVLDNEANDTPETAQALKALPCEIAGRIEKRRDRDWYEFSVTKGETYSIEVYSDRLGAPTDMYFLLRNLATKQETEVDAHSETLLFSFKFYAMTEDPGVFTFTAAADGKYQLMLASHTGDTQAGPRHFYRVRITQPEPDFHVAIMPPDNYRNDSCTLRQGGNAYYNVFLWRHDGFTGDVTLEAEDLPKGVTCSAQVIGSGVKVAKIVVSAAADAPEWTGEIKFKARGTIKGKSVVREARPVSITWPVQPQQNIRVANRFEQGLALAVRDKAPYSLTTDIAKATVTQGGNVTIPLKLARLWPDFKNQVQIVPDVREIPNTLLNYGVVNIPGNAANLVLNVNASAQPGTYNIVFRSFAPVPFNRDPMAKAKPNVNVVQCSTPVAVTILPKQVATVSLNNTNPTVKIGMQTEIVLSVNRQFNYDGEFKVQLVLPANIQGLSADELTIPAGKNEVKLVIRAAANAAPGNRPNLTVKTTALYNGTVPLVQESKINVNVVK